MRKNFADIFKEMKIDIAEEYAKLYDLLYNESRYDDNLYQNDDVVGYSPYNTIRDNFDSIYLNLNCTILDIDEFNRKGNFNFVDRMNINADEIDYLISFCEYIWNLSVRFGCNDLLVHIQKLIDQLGYMEAEQDEFTIFVEKNPAAIAVAEIVPTELSIKTLSYNHHSMKGDLSEKKSSLIQYADYLEPKRDQLKSVDKTLENNLFYAFNNFNIRHNNTEENNNKNYKAFIANMNKDELEKLYDETYQMCLLAILQLDNIERTEYINMIKSMINQKSNV